MNKQRIINLRRLFQTTLTLLALLCLSPAGRGQSTKTTHMEKTSIRLTLEGGQTFTARLADNTSAQALKELLAKGDITIDMEDYADMEKVGSLGTRLPRNDQSISTGPGDLILYQGTYFVIYYGTNSWNFTRLGKIDHVDASALRKALGSGDVKVTLSLLP